MGSSRDIVPCPEMKNRAYRTNSFVLRMIFSEDQYHFSGSCAAHHASWVESLPSDFTIGSLRRPTASGSASPTGQRQATTRFGSNGAMVTASDWFPPQHIRLP